MTTKFEAGRTYATPCIGDSDLLVRVTVVSRTAHTIHAVTDKSRGAPVTLRVREYEGVEQVSPWGRYSMSPIVGADDEIRGGLDPVLMAAVATALQVAACWWRSCPGPPWTAGSFRASGKTCRWRASLRPAPTSPPGS